MTVIEAIKSRRTIRKFEQKPIEKDILLDLIDCARLAPYPANIQPLKFAIVNESKILDQIFPHTKWAGYLQNGTPETDEKPVAFIIILGDKNLKKDFACETGIAGAHLTLAAQGYGIASCWLGAINREKIAEILNLPENLTVQDAIALGFPKQESRPVDFNDSVKYYLTDDGVLNVPKRKLEDVLYKF